MTKLTAKPQVCIGGQINPNGWDVRDTSGNLTGYVFHAPKGRFGDDRYWIEGPGLRRRGYATLDRALAAIERRVNRTREERTVTGRPTFGTATAVGRRRWLDSRSVR